MERIEHDQISVCEGTEGEGLRPALEKGKLESGSCGRADVGSVSSSFFGKFDEWEEIKCINCVECGAGSRDCTGSD